MTLIRRLLGLRFGEIKVRKMFLFLVGNKNSEAERQNSEFCEKGYVCISCLIRDQEIWLQNE